jgi:OOP family OmpA-OmpF porin
MKKDKRLRRLGLAGLGLLITLPSLAQTPEPSYFYGGLSVGAARAKIDQDRISASLLGAGLSTTAMTLDERDTAYKLFGGYQFNRYFGLEGGYFNLGKFGFTSTTVPAGSLTGNIRLQGLNLDLVASLPLSERWTVLGRVGAQMAQADDRFAGSGAVSVLNPNPRKREVNAKFGGGLQYAFSPSFLVRAEAERYRVNDAVGNHGNVNTVSLSLVFPFGRAAETAPRPVAAVAYEAPVRAPEPMPMPMPMPAPAPAAVAPSPPVLAVVPQPQRVSFSADSLFAFDRAEVRPDGKAALDRFARQLDGTRFDVVVVEGHTDRLGSTAYNQRLSEQRANAVKAYLTSPGGIDSSKIKAQGKGESQPVTRPEDCKGSRQTPALIACLQPDRRVDVEVTGNR